MRNITVTEVGGQWVVTLDQGGLARPQRYVCDNAALARRWALLLGGPPREHGKGEHARSEQLKEQSAA